jgi:DNA-binding FadR family transcriptional regulator
MKAADVGADDILEADIAFHVAVLKGSKNPFFAQFQDVVATALRSSIQFTNRIKGHSASIPDHAAVEQAIVKCQPENARAAMKKLVGDVLSLIDTMER